MGRDIYAIFNQYRFFFVKRMLLILHHDSDSAMPAPDEVQGRILKRKNRFFRGCLHINLRAPVTIANHHIEIFHWPSAENAFRLPGALKFIGLKRQQLMFTMGLMPESHGITLEQHDDALISGE
jgi:hypothetical protein